jgi:hypothetical protein
MALYLSSVFLTCGGCILRSEGEPGSKVREKNGLDKICAAGTFTKIISPRRRRLALRDVFCFLSANGDDE